MGENIGWTAVPKNTVTPSFLLFFGRKKNIGANLDFCTCERRERQDFSFSSFSLAIREGGVCMTGNNLPRFFLTGKVFVFALFRCCRVEQAWIKRGERRMCSNLPARNFPNGLFLAPIWCFSSKRNLCEVFLHD